jgi:hypothetical protein
MKTTSMLSLVLVCLAGAAFAADGPPPGEAASPPPKRAAIDWDKMNGAERKKYMKSTVLPEMKKRFVAFDAKHFKNMSCATCHGEKAAENKFKMPNPELPKLPGPTDRPAFMALSQKKPEWVKFMGTVVKPSIAALLNKDEWSPANPKGYGCYACHTSEATAAPAAPAAAPAGTPAHAGGGW